MKLILINGPTGIGKSTIALKVHEKMPLSFLLDIDAQRRYISMYKENRKESLTLILNISLVIADEHLKSGHDVIVDKVITDPEVSDKFLDLGKKHGADTYEFILNTDKETLVARANERGYKEGSMLTPEKVPEFWEAMQNYIKGRPRAIVVDTNTLNADDTFEYVRGKIFD